MNLQRAQKLIVVLRQLESQRRCDLARAEGRMQIAAVERAALLDAHSRLTELRLGFMTNIGARLVRNHAERSRHARDAGKLQAELRRLALVSKGVGREAEEMLRQEEEQELSELLEDWTARGALPSG